MAFLASLGDALRAALPVRDGSLEVALVRDPFLLPSGDVGIELRLVYYTDEGGLLDLKEAQARFVPRIHLADERRVLSLARAWAGSVMRIAQGSDDIWVLMPADLVFPELLDDASLRDESDFSAALGDDARRGAIARARAETELVEIFGRHLGAGDPRVPALLDLARRPTIAVQPEPAREEACALGDSRLGGHPDLPPEITWPCHGEQPLTFIGQLDLAALRASVGAAADVLLPGHGFLAFFYGLDGFDPNAADGGGRVLHVDVPREQLMRRTPPSAVQTLPSRTITFEAREPCLPGFDTPFYVLLTGARLEGWDDYVVARDQAMTTFEPIVRICADDAHEPRPHHRLLGYASALQSDPYIRCAATAARIPVEQRYDRAALEDAATWALLLQLDSEPAEGVSYGDDGTLQFFIRADDLTARCFDRVCAELQSH